MPNDDVVAAGEPAEHERPRGLQRVLRVTPPRAPAVSAAVELGDSSTRASSSAARVAGAPAGATSVGSSRPASAARHASAAAAVLAARQAR